MTGLSAVPLVVVGPHVYVGFDDEGGREILQQLNNCRRRQRVKVKCPMPPPPLTEAVNRRPRTVTTIEPDIPYSGL